jgi:hypothetical protein
MLTPWTLLAGVTAIQIWTIDWRLFPRAVEYCVKVIAVFLIIQFAGD